MYIIQQFAALINVEATLFFYVLSAIFFAFFIAILLPKLYEETTGGKVAIWQILTLFFCMFYFWNGFFYIPLKDFPAVAFLCAGLYYLSKYHKSQKLHLLLIIGALFACAAMIKSTYKFSVYILVLYFVIWAFKGFDFKNFKSRNLLPICRNFLITLSLLILPVLIITAPQAYFNYTNYHTVSFFPYFFDPGKISPQELFLYGDPFSMGKRYHGYNWQLHTTSQRGYPIHITDRHGMAIRIDDINKKYGTHYPVTKKPYEDYKILMDPESPYRKEGLKEYLKFLLVNPIDTTVLLGRRLFNGLDIKTSESYLHEVHRVYMSHSKGILFSVINYTLLFVFFMFCYVSRHKILHTLKNSKHSNILAIVLVPCFITLGVQMESRYILSLHLLIYVVISFYLLSRLNFHDIQHLIKKYYLQWFIFMSFCLALSSAITGGL